MLPVYGKADKVTGFWESKELFLQGKICNMLTDFSFISFLIKTWIHMVATEVGNVKDTNEMSVNNCAVLIIQVDQLHVALHE